MDNTIKPPPLPPGKPGRPKKGEVRPPGKRSHHAKKGPGTGPGRVRVHEVKRKRSEAPPKGIPTHAHQRNLSDEGLTPRQEAFAIAYVAGIGKGTQADAYLKAVNAKVSPHSAGILAGTMLKQPAVKAKVRALINLAAAKSVMSAEALLQTLSHIARADPNEMLNADLTVKPMSEIPEHVRLAIAGVKVTAYTPKNGDTVRTVEVKLCNRNEAIEKLMRHRGMFEADNSQRNASLFDNLTKAQLDVLIDGIRALERDHGVAQEPAAGHPGPTIN